MPISDESTRRQLLERLGASTVALTAATGPAAAGPPSNPGGGGGSGDTTDPTIESLDVSVNNNDTVTFDYTVSDNKDLNEVGYYIEKDRGNKIVDSGSESVDGTRASGDITTDTLDEKTYDWRFYVEDDANNRTYETGEVTVG